MKKCLVAFVFLVAAGSAFAFGEWLVRGGSPEFDGAWMRAYDMDIDEYYGFDKDKGWGAYCIETGWMTGYIPLVFMYEDELGSYFFRDAATHPPRQEGARPSSPVHY